MKEEPIKLKPLKKNSGAEVTNTNGKYSWQSEPSEDGERRTRRIQIQTKPSVAEKIGIIAHHNYTSVSNMIEQLILREWKNGNYEK